MPPAAPAGRFAHVDALRAVAALLVVWTHAAEIFAPLAGGSWLWTVARDYDFGRIGVVAFFGVSGFLVPSTIDPARPHAARAFVVRRFFRLYPAFWLSVPLGVIAVWWLPGKPIAMADIAANLTMVPDLFRAQPVMGLYWTLEYELAFYALCLGLLLTGLIRKRGVMAALTALFMAGYLVGFAALAVLHRQGPGDLGLISLNFAILFLGALWRRQLDGQLSRAERLVLLAAVAAVLVATPAACAWVVFARHSANPFFVYFPVSYGVGVALFLAMTGPLKLRWRPLAWVGLVSYSLYLLHPVVIYLMAWAFAHGWPGAHTPVWAQMLVAAVLSVGLAAAVFYVLERPATELGRRLSSGRTAGTPARPAPGAAGR
jgi:peptidoglycan/LPS O-acetylase OafA/YrhL